MRVMLKVRKVERQGARVTERLRAIGKTVTVNGVLVLHQQTGYIRWRRDLNAPLGVPRVALEWARKNGVEEFHLWEAGTGTLYVIAVEEWLRYGIEAQDAHGWVLLYAALPLWIRREGRGYDVPWNETVVTLEAESVTSRTDRQRVAA